MASLGSFALLLAFVMSAYTAAAAVTGARRMSARLVASAIGASYLVTALMTLASVLMLQALVTDDYRIKYVQHYSDGAQPLFYKLTSYWGGLDGSIMFWVFLLSVFGSLTVYVYRHRQQALMPYVVAVLAVVQMFFLFVMAVHNNPFSTFLADTPREGRGLNPLLQNVYMAVHPPALYVGFVGMTIPFAFCVAALVTGRLGEEWTRAARRWTLVSWLFLSLGLALGMIWAYEVLGWGGYWGWDPVENAGLLPWFAATALLHSLGAQQRRGQLRVWNVVLVVLAFFLTIFGTFLTRSGVVQSVHAFGEDRMLAIIFGVFMGLILVVSFGLLFYRLPVLRTPRRIDSWLSREAALHMSNWVFVFATLFVMLATLLPTLAEASTGTRMTVGPPFFDTWMRPVGLAVLLLTGVGPLLAWRTTPWRSLVAQFFWPVLVALAALVALTLAGVPLWAAGTCFALCALVATAVMQEFWRGARVRQRTAGLSLPAAMASVLVGSSRRFGGYIVHLGIAVMFVGFAGSQFKAERELLLRPGQEASLGAYVLRHEAVRLTDDGQKQMITAEITVLRDGRKIGTLSPARWLYRKYEDQPATQVAIRRGLDSDLYVVMPEFELKDQAVSLQAVIHPLVSWIWIGFLILMAGGMLVLLPTRVRIGAGVRARTREAAALAGLVAVLVAVRLLS